MATRRVDKPNENLEPRRRRPARNPAERENQLISQAVDLAEKQLREGTASAQVISHYLKLGSSRERLEQQRLENEVELLKTKREAIAAQQRVEELYIQAMSAFKSYSPSDDSEDEEEEEYYD